MWYVVEVAAQNNRESNNGIVQLCWFKHASIFDYDLRAFDRWAYCLSSCWPVKVLASHLCCLPTIAARFVKPIIHAFMDKDLRTHTIQHDVPESEILEVLSTYGICKDMVPSNMGGTVVVDQSVWITNRRAVELEEI